MRIELGRSLPTIVKLQYISDRLGVSLNYLLGETNIDIPEEYYQAKYRLMKSPVYGDTKRINQKSYRILMNSTKSISSFYLKTSFWPLISLKER